MKTMKFAAFIAAAMSVLALASCNPDPEGPQAEAQTGTVLFSIDNATDIYVAPGKATTVDVTVVRLEGTDATTYNIKVIDAADGVEVPESVSFQKDQTEATITISVPAGKAYDKFDYEIMLIGENVNDSANSEEGTLRFEGAVYVYDESIALCSIDGVAFKYLGYFQQKTWRMADGIIVVKDFLGSGADLTLLNKQNDASDGYGAEVTFVDYSNAEYCDVWSPWFTGEENADEVDDLGFSPDKYLGKDEDGNALYEYLPCYLKGDQKRYINAIDLYFYPKYAGYITGKSYDYVYLTVYTGNIYGESEGIDKYFEWAYLYISFVSEESLAEYDFGYPELDPEEEIGEGTTELWGLGTTGTATLATATDSEGSQYYVIKSWYGGTADLEIAFDADGVPYIHSSYDKYEDTEYNGFYTYYYTGRSDYYPYYLAGYEGYDTVTVTDADGNELTSVNTNPSSLVITFEPCYGVTGYSGGDYVDLTDEDLSDGVYTAWSFVYPAVVEEDE